MLRLTYLTIVAFSFLVGCASVRPLVLNADNPASPLAREAPTSSARPVLSLDQASKRTRELIAARAAQDTLGQPQQPDQQMQDRPRMKDMSGLQQKDDSSQPQGDHDH